MDNARSAASRSPKSARLVTLQISHGSASCTPFTSSSRIGYVLARDIALQWESTECSVAGPATHSTPVRDELREEAGGQLLLGIHEEIGRSLRRAAVDVLRHSVMLGKSQHVHEAQTCLRYGRPGNCTTFKWHCRDVSCSGKCPLLAAAIQSDTTVLLEKHSRTRGSGLLLDLDCQSLAPTELRSRAQPAIL